MTKINGIKSVDFTIVAKGEGVLNWNGSFSAMTPDGKKWVNNHSLPKLRGYSHFTGKTNEKGTRLVKNVTDINFNENPMYVSQNCIRHYLFKDFSNDLQSERVVKETSKILASPLGLLRGYVIPVNKGISPKKASSFLLSDFVEVGLKGNFEQFSRAGSKEKKENKDGKEKSDTMFSKVTFGETEYVSKGSINIEELQFISLDSKFDRCAIVITKKEIDNLIKEITGFIKGLPQVVGNPEVTYHDNYVRQGSIFGDNGEAGLLLNQDAVATLVEFLLDQIRELTIMKSKAYLYVEDLKVDYNDSTTPFRIIRDDQSISETPESPYAVYYKGV